ncbi:MAG: DUF1501 domain-containing protein, partial [Myxococcota bacterium]|nr:DUF1501 domain-containing protein [Myxococcota bacterium]
TYERIKQAMQSRLARIAGNTHLPRMQQSALSLANAQMSVGQLQDLRSYLPDDLDELDNKVISQAKVIAAACKAGICNGANLYLGGFDTHSYHNSAHPKRLLQLLMAVDTLMDEARRFGIQDRMLVVMGSEFTRTPYYNDSEPAGKDHWKSNSFMLMGPGIEGDRVVGRTDNQLKPVPVPVSGPVIMPAGGTVPSAIIGAHDVHASLRTHLGIDGLASNYPLDTPKFDFFA